MDGSGVLLLLFVPAILALMNSQEDNTGMPQQTERRFMRLVLNEPRRRPLATIRPGDDGRKLHGFVKPYEEDDAADHDHTMTVAVAPPFRPKYRKTWKQANQSNYTKSSNAGELIKDVLVQLGKEFMMQQVNEDFVFGQYVGNSMKNLTSDLKLKMQHEILEIAIKYQKMNGQSLPGLKEEKRNSTDDGWKDFNDLAKIVGG